MLNLILKVNFFATPFFIVSMVSLIILIVILLSLNYYYKKRKLEEVSEPSVTVLEEENSNQEDDVIVYQNEDVDNVLELPTDTFLELTKELDQVDDVEIEVVNEDTVEDNNVLLSEESFDELTEIIEQSIVEDNVLEESKDLNEESINSDTLLEESIEDIDELIEEKTLENKVDSTLICDVNLNLDKKVEPVIRYKKSFVAKLILNKELQNIYQELRDYILHYKKVKSRLSFKYERFSIGRKCLAKILVRGKKLYLYLALDSTKLDSKYHLVDVSNKNIGKELPSLLRVLSNRSIKYAKELIDLVMSSNEIELMDPDKFIQLDYKDLLKRRSLDKLIEDGLIVEYETTNDFFTNNGEYLTEEEIIAITPEKADELVSDEELDKVIIYKNSIRQGRMEVVNIDDLSNMFNSNDVIDLDAMIKAKLVSKNCQRVKVLARGSLDKKFTVEADAFSKQAMKMIVYKGGKVVLYK